MDAIRLHEFGPAENLVFEQVGDPVPGPGQVRIAVGAAGIHLIDTALRAGRRMGPLPLPSLPAIPGREVAGVVESVASDVDTSWLGRRVVAHLGAASGGYASLAVADAGALHGLPDGLPLDGAVAMIGTGRTTMAILDAAAVSAGDVVLVTAAAGGIGSLLVQAAHSAGAFVVGVAGGPDKMRHVSSLGADIAVDYAEPSWPEAVRGALGDREVTLALDGVGGAIGRAALELLGPGGRLILFGFASGTPTELSAGDLFARGLTVSAAIGPRVMRRAGGMRALEEAALAEAASGRWVPVVGQRFPLAADRYQSAAVARASIARVVILIGTVVAAILVAGILLVVLEANRSNDIVKAVHDAAQFLAGPFDGLFNLARHKVEIAVNWGIAAVVWYALARVIARLLLR
jgi:NADPH2:quinone reductase